MNEIFNQIGNAIIRIEAGIDKQYTSVGTGFILACCYNENTHKALLITNKHVVNNSNSFRIQLSYLDIEDNPVLGKTHNLELSGKNLWVNHPNDEIDLCAYDVSYMIDKLQKENYKPIYKSISIKLLPTEDDLKQMNVVEDVIMVGYPNGIWDKYNNKPIFRRGITATHPNLKYNNKEEFLIDIAAFPGSSGSPVFIYKDGLDVVDQEGRRLGGKPTQLFLAGVLYSGPIINVDGDVIFVDESTSLGYKTQSQFMLNLGNVISSQTLLEIEDVFKLAISKSTK